MNANQLIEQIKNSNDTFRHHQCGHTLPEGRRCGSPALRGETFCYYHHAERKPVADPRLRQARRSSFSLAQPRSRAAIQESLGEIIARIAQNDIDPRRAGLLLYALQIATTNLKDHQNALQHTASNNTTPEHANPQSTRPNPQATTQQECHPERSGAAAHSKDLRFHDPRNHQKSQNPFDAEIFPKPVPQLRPISRPTAATLLEALARHKGIQPQPGSPEDRRPTRETLTTLQAAEGASEAPIRPKNPADRQIHPSIRPVLQQETLQSPNSRMSPTCLQFVISSHKVLPPEHLGYLRRIRRYITNLN